VIDNARGGSYRQPYLIGADGMNEASASADWSYVATGYVGTDAIKPTFIFRSSRVTPKGDFAVLDSSVDPEFVVQNTGAV